MSAAQGELKSAPLSLAEFAELSGVLAGVIVFIYLIGADTLKALKKRAYWIPGDALVLSALTIQVLNLLDGHSSILKELLDDPKALNGEVVKNNLFMIHSSRVMLCVLVAYLLPGMARPGSEEDSWNNLAALGLSIFMHISSELSSVHKRLADSGLYLVSNYFYFWPHARKITEGSFIISGVIISLTLLWLISLLSSAIIANKSIRDIIRQKIPKILARKSNDYTEYYSWPAVEHQVLKSWIVARACYPEYIIARSVLATSAALAVTICVLSSIIAWLFQGPIVILFDAAASWLKFMTTSLEAVFILIGWAIICWRWLTSVAYYGRWQRQKEPETWRGSFMVEDFWTRHIVELQEAAHEKKQKREVDERVSKMIATEENKICLPRILLRCVFWLQFCVVFFSKGCWFLSKLVFYNKLTIRLSPKLFLKHVRKMEEDTSQYKEFLQDVPILWETTVSVFVANRKSIKQAEELLQEGYGVGKECATLISFLRDYYRSPGCLDIRCLDLAGTGNFKFLCKPNPGPDLDVEKHFIFASKPSWKLAAVSLINIIVRLSPECGKDSVKAYCEALELMDLVDESDPETDSLLSKAADSLFQTLQQRIAENTDRATTTIEAAAATIKKLAEESELKAKVIGDGQDSLDWRKAAAGNALYKLCKSIDCGSGDFKELINELQSALAGVIGACILKVKAALMDNCIQWAQDLQERKLLTAIYTAGKCKGLMEKLEWVDISATTREPTMASQA